MLLWPFYLTVTTDLLYYCGLQNLAENWSRARDVNGRDRNETATLTIFVETRRAETLIRLKTISRPTPQPWLLLSTRSTWQISHCSNTWRTTQLPAEPNFIRKQHTITYCSIWSRVEPESVTSNIASEIISLTGNTRCFLTAAFISFNHLHKHTTWRSVCIHHMNWVNSCNGLAMMRHTALDPET